MFDVGNLINDQFKVERRIVGGMGVVYVAVDQVTERMIAIKTLRDDLHENEASDEAGPIEELRDRFEREARAWINLGHHPHIVPAISFHRGTPALLLLDFIEGVPLNLLISQEPQGLALSEALRYALHISRALQHAHECPMPRGGRGVIHRDIKPHNVMIQKDRTARVTDFGLARVGGEERMTSSKSVMGTLQYMPPEQYEGLFHTNERSDLYSFGVVVYEMICGKLPFPGRSIPELWYQIRECDPQPIRELRPRVDLDLEELVARCLRKSPEDRPESATEVAEQISDIAGQLTEAESPDRSCAGCGYLANREHLVCPLCGRAPRPKAIRNTWVCHCRAEMPMTFRFCTACGARSRNDWACGACGSANPTGFRFCCRCGRPGE